MKKLFAVLICIIGMESAVAADPIPADVRSAVDQYMVAMQKDGIAAATKFLHPEALAQFKQMFLASLSDSTLRMAFGESATLDSVKSLPPAEFVEKMFASSPVNDAVKQIVSEDILGAVKEGELWHVITRTTADVAGSRVTTVAVTTLKRDGKAWKALLATTTVPLPGAKPLEFERPPMPDSEPPAPPPPPPRGPPPNKPLPRD